MYVAVKGGEKAIAAAHALLARERRGDVQIPEVTLEQLAGQLKLAMDRIMAEGSLYSPELAALAFKLSLSPGMLPFASATAWESSAFPAMNVSIILL